MDILAFLATYKYIIIFYLAIIGFFIYKRKSVELQAKIIALYRMKWGIKWMDKYAKKHRAWVILLGYIGAGLGFVGMIFMSVLLIKNLVDLFTIPNAASGVSLVLPGVNVPGLGVLPFWYWLLAIFLIAVVHEFAHGIVARAHDIEVKNTGIVLFGPILGAFVEPNEEKLRKKSDIAQYSVLAAGAFANALLALLAVVLLLGIFTPLQNTMIEPNGFSFSSYSQEGLPAQLAGLPTDTPIIQINGKTISTFQEASTTLERTAPGEEITFATKEASYTLTLAQNPQEEGKGLVGIQNIKNEFIVKPQYESGIYMILYDIVSWLVGFLRWLFLLSLGIGLFNLLPLPIVDGGRMIQVFFHQWKGVKKGNKWYGKVGAFFLLILLLNLFAPLLMKVM